ncbi:MAG: hypothetical protein IJ660_00390 [Alphaproteobacteria bacterium]|nr:hypothetical protein [Alphaproteobacteria bacterium]
MNTYAKVDLISSRNTVSQPITIRRGNLSVLATAEFRDGQMVSTPINRQRYVWPNPYSHSSTGFMARRFLGR